MFVSVSCISLNAREVFLLLFFWCYYIEKTWFFIPLALKFTKKYMNLHKWTFASEFFVFLLLFFYISFQSENYQIESAFVPIPGSKSFLKVDEHVAFVCNHALPSYCKDFTQIQVLQTKWPTKYAAQLKFACSKSTTESFKKKCEICSKVTVKTTERRHWRRTGVCIVNFEHISHLFPVLLVLNLNK